MRKAVQNSFFATSKSAHSYGGDLRNKRTGRGVRPLSTKDSHHIVFKIHRPSLQNRSLRHPKNFKRVKQLLEVYAARFFVKVEQVTLHHDHIHLIARTTRRSNFHNFFRVFAGQIAQNLKVTDTPKSLWVRRPFSRIVRSWKSFLTLRKYLALNELEARGLIPYQIRRLSGLSSRQMTMVERYLQQLKEIKT